MRAITCILIFCTLVLIGSVVLVVVIEQDKATVDDDDDNRHESPMTAMFKTCNLLVQECTGRDHGLVSASFAGNQIGPGRSSRAEAIIHIAMLEAAIACGAPYQTLLPPEFRIDETACSEAETEMAIAHATHKATRALFPQQKDAIDEWFSNEVVGKHRQSPQAFLIGDTVASHVLKWRKNDNSEHAEPHIGVGGFTVKSGPGMWGSDPVTGSTLAMGGLWPHVKPFALESASQFECPPPPKLSSERWARAYNYIRTIGGDGETTKTLRTDEETLVAVLWAYDGVPFLCAPPKLYNQIAMHVLHELLHIDGLELLWHLTRINVGLADAGISAWHSKYKYNFWRPDMAMRAADTDGNDDTAPDKTFTPLGAPASNVAKGRNFTPRFPAYPSGHAVFGATLFRYLELVVGEIAADQFEWSFVSDEFNGTTKGVDGLMRPRHARHYTGFKFAKRENGRSREYLGIHFEPDITEGIAMGDAITNHLFEKIYTKKI